MRAPMPYIVIVLLGVVSGALGQTNDPISDIISQALSVYTEVRSILTASTTTSSTTSTSSSSSISTTSASTSSSSSSSSFSSAVRTSTSSQSASNTAEAAAASSTAAAAMAAANAQTRKNRTTAIALGVVLGLLALALLIGLLLFCLRRRRRQRAKASRHSVSPEAVSGASWGKEPLSHNSTFEKPKASRLSTDESHRAPLAATVPLMAGNTLNGHDGRRGSGNGVLNPHRGAPNFQSNSMEGGPPGPRPLQGSPSSIPLSSHSRSTAAAAGLGGAALGGMAAKHHHDKHDQREFGRNSQDHHQGITRKPVRGDFGDDRAQQHPSMGMGNDSVPGYQPGYSGPHHGDMKTSPGPLPTSNIPSNGSSPGNGNPPAYSGSTNPLSSHPPFGDNYRHSTGHEPLMAGAAGVAAGAAGGAALEKQHSGNQHPDSSLTGRRSWDHNRQPQHPQSIISNPAGRRSIGSTNPYVPARSPGNVRFSDGDVTDPRRYSHGGSRTRSREDINQNNTTLPKMERRDSPKMMSPTTDETANRVGSPRHNIPGSWRGSGEWDPTNNRTSPSNDNNPNNQTKDLRPRGPSLSELRQQEEDDQWYRGRYIGDRKSADLSRPGHDSRFYADRQVGQAM